MKRTALIMLMMANSAIAYASDAENIMACVKKANEFSGVTLSEFDVSYQGNILAMSTAKWGNAHCEVKFNDVYNLQVNGNQVIFNRFAGRESYDLNKALEVKTETAINQLKSRIALLEQRMSQVSVSLKMPKPDHVWLNRYIDEGIEKSIGVKPQETAPATAPAKAVPIIQSPPVSHLVQDTPRESLTQTDAQQEVLIPRSVAGDKGKYYLLEAKRTGDTVSALHKRVGADSVGYTRTETNCNTMLMRTIGYGEESPAQIKENPTKWFGLVPGSSKSDLANFLCKR